MMYFIATRRRGIITGLYITAAVVGFLGGAIYTARCFGKLRSFSTKNKAVELWNRAVQRVIAYVDELFKTSKPDESFD